MQLTQEYFDKGLANLWNKIQGRLDNMVTKDEFKEELAIQSSELKQYTRDAFQIQQDWMDERFKELIPTYNVRERVSKLEKDVAQLKLGRH